MALAAVLFALPFSLFTTASLCVVNGLGIHEAALVYVLAGLGSMTAVLLTAKSPETSRI